MLKGHGNGITPLAIGFDYYCTSDQFHEGIHECPMPKTQVMNVYFEELGTFLCLKPKVKNQSNIRISYLVLWSALAWSINLLDAGTAPRKPKLSMAASEAVQVRSSICANAAKTGADKRGMVMERMPSRGTRPVGYVAAVTDPASRRWASIATNLCQPWRGQCQTSTSHGRPGARSTGCRANS